jgi:hypothetical protein
MGGMGAAAGAASGGMSYAAFRAANAGAGAAAWKTGGKMNLAYHAQKGAKVAPLAARASPWIGRAAMGGMALTGVGALALAASIAIPMYMQYKQNQGKAGGGYLTPMAQGGYPSSGAPYLVGEQGPELFVPSAAGQLLNNGATQNTIGNGMKLNNVTIGIDSFGGLV